jgi:ATP-binding cassette subfamily B protein
MNNKLAHAMFNHIKEGYSVLKKLVPYLGLQSKPFKKRIIFSLFFLAVTIFLNIALPLLLKRIVDLLGSVDQINYRVLIIISSFGIIWMCTKVIFSLRELVLFRVMERMISTLNHKFLEHISKLPMTFYVQRHSGEVLNTLERALAAFPNIFWGLIFSLIPIIIEMILAIIILFALYGITYSTILFLGSLGFFFFSIFSTKKALKLRRLSNEADKLAKTQLVENLLHFETIRYFGNHDYELKRYALLLNDKENYSSRVLEFLATSHIIQNTIIGLTLILLTVMAGAEIIYNKLKVGDFVLIQSYVLQFFIPLSGFGALFRNMQQSLTDMENFFAVLEIPLEENNFMVKKDIKPIKNTDIHFKNVSFGYTPPRKILHNSSFVIPEGKVTALIGVTGVGKSTITKLLSRFYTVNRGEIFIGSINIKDIDPNTLSQIIGYAPQEAALFNDTISYNIRYGNLTASEDDILRASAAANLSDFINNLPQKYETVVGERGVKLSGGEKQRISLARLFLKNPKILILDEPTSSLDAATTQLIQESIKKLAKNRTVLIITHKYDTALKADQILLLAKGGTIRKISSYEEGLINLRASTLHPSKAIL